MLLMTGLYCVCPPLGHMSNHGVFSVGFCTLWRVALERCLYLCGYGSVKAQRAHLTQICRQEGVWWTCSNHGSEREPSS